MQAQNTLKSVMMDITARVVEIAQNADDISVVVGCVTSSIFAAVFNFKSDSSRNIFSAKASFNLTVVGDALSVIVGDMLCVGSTVGTKVGITVG
jgi:hypothetical protein